MILTQKETDALVALRGRVKDILENPEDHFLIRWLRARNLDIKKAEEMLRNYVDWTVKNETELNDAAHYIPPQHISDRLAFKFIGLDYEGRPVLWLPIGRWELRKVLTEGHRPDCIQYEHMIMGQIAANIEEQRKLTGLNQFVVLADSSELSFWKLAHYETIEMVLRFFREFEAYYPEYLHSCYIVNNPRVFSYIFNLVKPLLSQHTLSKAYMFDYNQSKWSPALLQAIPPETLPVEYGGTGKPVLS